MTYRLHDADINAGKSIQTCLEDERNFFENHPVYSRMGKELTGVSSLVEKLAHVLFLHAKHCLPQLCKEVSMKSHAIEERLHELGPVSLLFVHFATLQLFEADHKHKLMVAAAQLLCCIGTQAVPTDPRACAELLWTSIIEYSEVMQSAIRGTYGKGPQEYFEKVGLGFSRMTAKPSRGNELYHSELAASAPFFFFSPYCMFINALFGVIGP